MRYLRTVSTQRLLATIAGFVLAIAAGTAIAVAAAGNGPVPPPKPLARAIHDALNAPAVQGISARITFTNHLIDSSNIQGSDPLLTGATGRLWLSEGRLRLELQGDNGDGQIVVNDGSLWIYDPTSNTVYEGSLPSSKSHKANRNEPLPSIADIQSYINRLMGHITLSGAIPSDVAGRPAYTVKISPKHDGGLLGSAELAWDAVHGIPLRFAIYARGENSPVLEIKATSISFGAVSKSIFTISPPSGAKVVRLTSLRGRPDLAALQQAAEKHRASADVTGVKAVASHLHFKLVAPASLVGLPRQSVSLLDWGGSPAALITYGQNFGGIAVIEQSGRAQAIRAPSGEHAGLTLPTVSIDGATGQELDTMLGTMLRFTRGNVTFTVLGSVPPAAAEAAARAL